MLLVNILQPKLVLGGPVTLITPRMLEQYCLKGLILDVDETLVPWNDTQVSNELSNWIEQIKNMSISLYLVSNNLSQERIGNIAQALDLPYILGAAKPSRRKLKKAIEQMNIPESSVAMVGDRLFTDVLAGNRLGLFTILVEPMIENNQTRKTWTYLIRNLEIFLSRRLGVSLNPGHNLIQKDQ